MASLVITSKRTTANTGTDTTAAVTSGTSTNNQDSSNIKVSKEVVNTSRISDETGTTKSAETVHTAEASSANDVTNTVTQAHNVVASSVGGGQIVTAKGDFGYKIAFEIEFAETLGTPAQLPPVNPAFTN